MFRRTLIRYYYSSRYSATSTATATVSDSIIGNSNRIVVLRNGIQSFIDYIKENKRLVSSPIVLITSLPSVVSNPIPGSLSKSTIPKSTTITNNDIYTNEICSYINFIIQQQFNLRVVIVNYPLLPSITTSTGGSSSNSSSITSTSSTITAHKQQTQTIFPLQTDIDKTIELANRIGAKTVIGVGTESTINLAKAVASYRYNSTGSTGSTSTGTSTDTLEPLFKEVVLIPTTYNSIVSSLFSHSLLLNYKEETIDIYPSLPLVTSNIQKNQQQQQQQQSTVPLISTTIVPVEASRMYLLSSFTKIKSKLLSTTKEENDVCIALYNKDINDTIVTVLGLLSVLLDILLYDCNQSHHKQHLSSIEKTEVSIVPPVSLVHLMKTLQNGIVIIRKLQHLSNQLQNPLSSDEATTSTNNNNDTIDIDQLHDTIISLIFDCSHYVSFGDKYTLDIPNHDSNTGTTTTTSTSTGSSSKTKVGTKKTTTQQYRSVSLGIAVSLITKIFPDYTIIEIMSSIGTTLCEQIVTNSTNQEELVELINNESITTKNNNNNDNNNTNTITIINQQQLFQQLLVYYQQYTPLLLSRETHQTIINEIQSNQIVWNTIPIDRSSTILSNIIKNHQFII